MKIFNTELSATIHSFIDFFFPRFCICCQERLSINESHICGACQLALPRAIVSSFEDNEMARIFWGLIPIERCATLFYYTKNSVYTRILMKLKYGNQPKVGITMGRMLAKSIYEKGFFNGIDVIVPVPLSKERERQRGYNQSEWIAKGISEITSIKIYNNFIVRTKVTPSQTSLKLHERLESVQGAFQLKDTHDLIGKHILLVDDVLTTGATLLACAETIAKIPKTKISIVTLARTHY